MPKYQVTSPDGQKFEVTAPDGATQDQVLAFAQAQFSAQKPREPATLDQKILSSIPARVVKGMKDPIDALAQLAPRGLSAISSLGGLNPNPISRWLDSESGRVDQMNQAGNDEYAAARQATAPRDLSSLVTGKVDPGFDAARMAGNMLSPANAAVAARLPVAATTLGRIGTGMLGGAVGGAMTPVEMKEGTNFAGTKLAQVGLGAATGGIVSPLLGKVADKVGQFFANRAANKPIDLMDIDRIVRSVSEESGQRFENLEPAMQQQLRAEAIKSLQAANGRIDSAAALRKADFEKEGMLPTAGQITRDASQYARERNLRTMPGVGDPLLQRFEQQGKEMQGKFGAYAAGASENFSAGDKLANALKSKDESLRAGVSSAYKAARDSAGKDMEIPLGGMASDAADVIDRFGDKVPSGVLNQLRKYGVLPDQTGQSAPRKLFTVEAADDLIKTINSNQSNDPATNAALGRLRDSVKNAVTKDAGVDDVFAPARKAAADRFRMQDAVPALKAASEGTVAPDDFIRKYVINGKTNDVKGMADILSSSSPEAFKEARSQLGAHLQRAAFGENLAGDKPFAPERYAKALRDLGTEKLSAFFKPEEVAQLQRLGRVGAYINTIPNASPVQTSNNWGAIMSVAGKIPGVPSVVGLANAAKTSIGNQSAVTRALAAEVPKLDGKMTPEQIATVAKLLSGIGVVSGSAAAEPIK